MAARQLSDGNDDGTILGQSATDKVGFYGKTPVARPAHIADATNETTTMAAVNSIIAILENLGLKATS